MRKKIELGTAIFFIVAAVFITGIVTFMYMKHMAERSTGKSEMFEKLSQVYQVVNNRYVGEYDDSESMDTLLSGFIEGVDRYGVYLDKASYLEYKNGLDGKTSGIGLNVKYVASTGLLKITRVRAGSPAEDAGLMAGDIITKIDDTDVSTLSYNDATTKLQAAIGTEIKLTLLRKQEEIKATVAVQVYTEETVSSRVLVNNTGYVSISEFDTNTTEDFKTAVENLKTQGVSKFIFDVRNNTGGSLTSVTEILDYILPKGTICSTKDRIGTEKKFSSEASYLEGDIVVLINGGTYSGGELFAAAIRDFKFGTLIGSRTYGKGMAQEVIPLGDESALYLSTNMYYSPNGENYEGVGVAPHVEVKLSADQEDRFYELTFDEDTQLQQAMATLNP
jgi:carboxyl-terminal processing protease